MDEAKLKMARDHAKKLKKRKLVIQRDLEELRAKHQKLEAHHDEQTRQFTELATDHAHLEEQFKALEKQKDVLKAGLAAQLLEAVASRAREKALRDRWALGVGAVRQLSQLYDGAEAS